jgi:hypothetical protein
MCFVKLGELRMRSRAPGTIIVVALILVILAVSFSIGPFRYPSQAETGSTENPSIAIKQEALVPLDQIVSGGPPPDGIPSIDNPKFIPVNHDNFLSDSESVIGINFRGITKAYPLQILVWHEIVNDNFSGLPIAVTYCPLCYSSSVFVSQIRGNPVAFGTSWKLYNNNLVMYDRLTRSLWSEMLGQAIAGNLAGYMLERVPSDLMTWGQWKNLYPNTLILSRDTGYSRAYGSNPYGGYYTDSQILFPLSHRDERLPLKEVVLGLSLGGSNRAYPLKAFIQGSMRDSLNGTEVVFFSVATGAARAFNPSLDGRELHFQYSDGSFSDLETHSVWNYDGLAVSGPLVGMTLARLSPVTAFWFAWAAFYPNTGVYNAP